MGDLPGSTTAASSATITLSSSDAGVKHSAVGRGSLSHLRNSGQVPSAGVPARTTLLSLQMGRFVAASVVVMFHLHVSRYFGRPPFGPLFDFGFMGVDYFFVLSGFIILYAHWEDIGRPGRVWPFAWRRIRRVYPAYLVVAVLTSGSMLLSTSLGREDLRDPLHMTLSLLLLPTSIEPVVLVAWSLQHELLFYALFAALIWRPAVGACLLGSWFMLSGTIGLALPFPLSFLAMPYHLDFLFGMLGAVLLIRTTLPFPRVLLGLGLAGIAALAALSGVVLDAGHVDAQRTTLLVPMGLASLLVVLGSVEAERQGLIRLPAVSGLLGDASYALYLLHLPVIVVGGKLFGRVAPGTQPEILALALYGLSVGIALLFYRFVEQPMLRALAPGSVSTAPPPSARRTSGETSRP